MTNAERIRKYKNIELAELLIYPYYKKCGSKVVCGERIEEVEEVYKSPAGVFDDFDKALKATNSWLYKESIIKGEN